MAKPELGTKRICGECGAKFYDLNKAQIICPKCGTPYDVTSPASTSRIRPETPKAEPAAEQLAIEEEDIQDQDLVPLEDADTEEEETGRASPEVDGDEIPDLEEENLDDDSDDGFLEDEDEGDDDDVSGLIDSDIEDDRD